MANWYVDNRGERFGPVPEDMVIMSWQSGRITNEALVCVEGDNQWQPLTMVPGIAARMSLAPTPVYAPPNKLKPTPIWLWAVLALAILVGVGQVFAGPRGGRSPSTSSKRSKPVQGPIEPLPNMVTEPTTKPTFTPPAEPAAGGGATTASTVSGGCKTMSASAVRGPCKAMVKTKLAVPSSAKFPWTEPVPTQVGCTYVYSATVDSKNAFGVMMTNSFTCTVDPVKDTISVTFD